MKKLFLIVLSTFVFSCYVEAYSQTLPQKSPSDTEKSLRVKFCNIISKPEDFEGKLIRMSVTYRSIFMQGDLLLSSSCKDKFIIPAIDDGEGDGKAKKKIGEKLQYSTDQVVSDAYFTVVGVLRKNKYKGRRPIKNLLQNYTFHIKEVE